MKLSHALLLLTAAGAAEAVDCAGCCGADRVAGWTGVDATADDATGADLTVAVLAVLLDATAAGLETATEEEGGAVGTSLTTPLLLCTTLAATTGLTVDELATGAVMATGLRATEEDTAVAAGAGAAAAAGKLVCVAFFIPHSRHTSGLNACAT